MDNKTLAQAGNAVGGTFGLFSEVKWLYNITSDGFQHFLAVTHWEHELSLWGFRDQTWKVHHFYPNSWFVVLHWLNTICRFALPKKKKALCCNVSKWNTTSINCHWSTQLQSPLMDVHKETFRGCKIVKCSGIPAAQIFWTFNNLFLGRQQSVRRALCSFKCSFFSDDTVIFMCLLFSARCDVTNRIEQIRTPVLSCPFFLFDISFSHQILIKEETDT